MPPCLFMERRKGRGVKRKMPRSRGISTNERALGNERPFTLRHYTLPYPAFPCPAKPNLTLPGFPFLTRFYFPALDQRKD